jgi:hypothetical protein
MKNKPFSFCHFCGSSYVSRSWPRTCLECGQQVWKNPLPVAVALTPVIDKDGVHHGLLGVMRSISPHGPALAGGYIDAQERPEEAPGDWHSETWQEAISREVYEETLFLNLGHDETELFDVQSAPDGTVLIFGITQSVTPEQVECCKKTNETDGAFIITPDNADDIVFDLHREAVEAYFGNL